MKKILSSVLILSLVAVMLVGLVGCGDKTVDNPPVENPPVVENPVETPDVSDTPVETPPVETPEVVVSIDDIVNTMANTFGEYYIPTMPLDAETFNMMLNIEADKASEYYSEFYAGMPMMGTHVDKLFIAKTSDVTKMTDTFKAYMDAQISDTMQYPMNVSKLENYVITNQGDYVILFILGGYTEETPAVTEGKTEEEIATEQEAINVAYYQACNDKALAALSNLFANGYIAPETDETTTPVEDETVTPVEEVVEGVVDAVVEGAEAVVDAVESVVDETANENTTDETVADETVSDTTEVTTNEDSSESTENK